MTVRDIKTNDDIFKFLDYLDKNQSELRNKINVFESRLKIFDLRLTNSLKRVNDLIGQSDLFDDEKYDSIYKPKEVKKTSNAWEPFGALNDLLTLDELI